jgi:hypothetical protein
MNYRTKIVRELCWEMVLSEISSLPSTTTSLPRAILLGDGDESQSVSVMAVDLLADADDRSTELTERPEQDDGINCNSSSKTIHHTSLA